MISRARALACAQGGADSGSVNLTVTVPLICGLFLRERQIVLEFFERHFAYCRRGAHTTLSKFDDFLGYNSRRAKAPGPVDV
jgi:hypothetical protein